MADTPEPISYTLRFPAPYTHYVEVEAIIPTNQHPHVELMMAVWTPGSYMVREYARHIDGVSASTPQGQPLQVDKSRKNRWCIRTEGANPLQVTYRVYCREMTVRTNWIEDGFAMLNGASTFLTLVEDGPRPHDVRLVLPDHWQTTITGLPPLSENHVHAYRAVDFDTLVDSPILAGNPAVYPFEVEGKPHYVVNEGEGDIWDGPRAVRDVEKIVRAHRDMWGCLPYDKYVFMNMITEAGGGLEHKNSTLLMTSRWNARVRKGYLDWLSLVSHEFFHVWNGKRLRPIELGPFDYENEVYTTSLWVIEGVTSYYTELGLTRAGLCTLEEALERFSRLIERLQTTPGRLVHPLEMTSYDAWIKFYRGDENSPNTTVSYYTKGAVVAWLLDAKMQRATAGAKSLDDVMRLAYERYAGARGFTREEFRDTIQDVAGFDLTDWFMHVLERPDELDYTEMLDWFGLRFAPQEAAAPKAWLGIEARIDNGRLLVSQIRRGTPGWHAGLTMDDEILAINDYRVRPEQWVARLEQYRPDDTVCLLVARREQIRRFDVTLAARPRPCWTLATHPEASPTQRARLQSWLGLDGHLHHQDSRGDRTVAL